MITVEQKYEAAKMMFETLMDAMYQEDNEIYFPAIVKIAAKHVELVNARRALDPNLAEAIVALGGDLNFKDGEEQ